MGRFFEDSDVTVGMMTADDAGVWGSVDVQALIADGDFSVAANAGFGALSKDVGPPRAFWGWSQDGAFLSECLVPGGLGGGGDFAMFFHLVMVFAQGIEQVIGRGQLVNVFGLKEWGQTFLPELVTALDFAFGLGSGSITEGDGIKAQSGGQLGVGLWGVGEEEAVIIDIETEGQTVGLEDAAEEVHVGEESFTWVKTGAEDDAAVIVEDVEQTGLPVLIGEPVVGRSIVLPELADLLSLPAPDGFALG